MIVVSDTSPILNLAAIDRLNLLGEIYREVVIPPAVEAELLRNGVRPDLSWLRVVAVRNTAQLDLLREDLDAGEAEAIVVATEIGAELILVDERRGRRIAINRGLTVTGLLGVLAEAKGRGLIARCGPILDDMMRIAGFWIGEDLRTRYLEGLNESEQGYPGQCVSMEAVSRTSVDLLQ